MKRTIFPLLFSILLLGLSHATGQENNREQAQVKQYLKALDVLAEGVREHSSFKPDFRKMLMQNQQKTQGEAYYDYTAGNRVQRNYMEDDKADTLLNRKLTQDMQQLAEQEDAGHSLDKNYEKSKTIKDAFNDSLIIKRLNSIPTSLQYTYNAKVKNFIKLYLQKRPRQVALMAGLAEHYFPIFERILDMKGLPLELKYLPIIESALNPTAYSRAGASGLWQFMYYTGKIYDLEVNTLIDERRDPLKSTYAAAEHLTALYKKYQNWSLVIAAYNCGQGRVDRAIRRTGKHDFWDIYYYLPRETRGYVPAFVAANYVMNYYEDYGITPVDIEIPQVAANVDIHEKLHLKQVAEYLKLDMEYLKALNPQYRKNVIPAGEKVYSLRLPEDAALRFAEASDSIYNYKKDRYIKETREKQVASTHTSGRSSRYQAPDIDGKAKVYYQIKPGDNMGFIAEWFDVRASDIRYWNNLRSNRIIAGKKLLIYVPQNKAASYKQLNSMTFAEKQEFSGNTKTAHSSNQQQMGKDGSYIYYTVKRGDNLWNIARKFSDVSNTDIKRINNFSYQQVQHLKPGMVIKIKKKDSRAEG